MPDTEQTPLDQLTTRHQAAQTAAFEWAQTAETQQQSAEERADYARTKGESPYLRSPVTEARQDATYHSGRSADASRLAQMWAHVALALAPLHAPANGQPATYDIQLIGAGPEIENTIRRLKQRGGPAEPSQ